MALPDVADLALIPATNHAAGADQNPIGAPLNGKLLSGAVFRRSGNIVRPAAGGWADMAATAGGGPRTGLGVGAIWRLSGAKPSGLLLTYLTTGGANGYHLRISNEDIYLQAVLNDTGTWLDGLDLAIAANSALAMIANPDGVAGFYAPDGTTWSRILVKNDTSKTGTFALGTETNAGTTMAFQVLRWGPLGAPPTVAITAGPSRQRISAVAPWDETALTFTVSAAALEWEIRAVLDPGAPRHTGDPLVTSGGAVAASAAVAVSHADLDGAGLTVDGTYLLKVFARNAAGWSS